MRELLLALGLGMLLTLACGGDSDEEKVAPTQASRGEPVSSTPRATLPLSVQAWASHVCRVAEDLQARISAIGDDVDRESLPLEQRKERIARLSPQVVSATEQAAKELAAVEPPLSARTLHEALQRNLLDIAAAQTEAQRRYAAATTVAQLEATNEALINTVERSGERLQLTAQRAPANVTSALSVIQRCGSLVFGS